MHQILVQPFGFSIYSYSAALLVAFAAGLFVIIQVAKSRGPTNPEYIQELIMVGILWGIFGSRLGWVFWEFDQYVTDPLRAFNLREGGMTILGGIVVPIIAFSVIFKRKGIDPRNVLDTCAPGLLMGMAVGRLGCILHGCCFGNLCEPSFPLALTYPEGIIGQGLIPGPRYPTQLFEAGADLLLMALVIWRIPRQTFAGQGVWTMLTGYGIIRFLNEYLRGDIKVIGPITLAQWVAVAMFSIGVLGLLGVFGRPKIDSSWQTGDPKKGDA